MFAQYLVGPGYESYPAVLMFHLALFILGGTVAVRAWSDIAADELPPMGEHARRTWSWVVFGLAAFVVFRYLPALLGSIAGADLTSEFRAEPAFFWTIFVMDLGVVVPCAVATGIFLRRGSLAAVKATYALLGWFALVPPSVAAMAITMLINDDPHRSTPASVLFVLVTVACTVVAVRLFRPWFDVASGPRVGRVPDPAHRADDRASQSW